MAMIDAKPTVFCAELHHLEPFENGNTLVTLFGTDERKLYELLSAEVRSLGLHRLDWKGDHRHQEVTDDKGGHWVADVFAITLVC